MSVEGNKSGQVKWGQVAAGEASTADCGAVRTIHTRSRPPVNKDLDLRLAALGPVAPAVPSQTAPPAAHAPERPLTERDAAARLFWVEPAAFDRE